MWGFPPSAVGLSALPLFAPFFRSLALTTERASRGATIPNPLRWLSNSRSHLKNKENYYVLYDK